MTTITPESLENMSQKTLRKLVEYGMIELMATKKSITKEDFPEYKKHKDLAGNPIHISKAARKYNISDATIIRYVDRGFIKVVGKDKNRILLNEQDVAYCVDILNEYGGKGKQAFNEDGTPNY